MGAVTIDELQIRVNGTSTNAYAAVDALVGALEKLQSIRIDGGIARSIDGIGKAASSATKKVSKMSAEFARAVGNANKFAMTFKNFGWSYGNMNTGVMNVQQPFQQYGAGYTDIFDSMPQLGLDDVIDTSFYEVKPLLLTMAHDTVTGFNETITLADRLKAALAGIGKAVRNVKTAISPAIEHFKGKMAEAGKEANKFFKSVQRIAMYRAIRSALKFITQALKEGVQNLAQYSKAIGETDTWAANSVMSEYATKLLEVKNAVGSAVMPVLSALQPVIMSIANAFIYATNALNMFFSALGGKGTYTKAQSAAVDYAATLDKSSAGAKKAAKELSAGFDELNVISDNSGGGGGSSSNGMPAYSDMFGEEVIPKKLIDNLELIKNLAIAIGLAFLAWKIASLFTDDLSKIAGIAMAVAGAFILAKGAIDAWENGVNLTNLMEMLGGTALLAGGLAIAFGTVGAAIGLLIGGIVMLVVGIRDWIKTGELTEQTLALICAGVLAIGLAISLLTMSWIPIAIAGVIALGLVIYKYWDEIKAFCIMVWTAVADFFVDLWESIKTTAENVWNAIGNFFAVTIPTIINNIFTWFLELPSKIAYALGFVLGSLFAWEQNVANWIITEVPKLISKIVEFFAGLPEKIKTAIDKVKNTIVQWVTDAIGWVKENIPKIINEVVDWFAKLPSALVNVGKNMIKALWNGILSMGDWLWNKVTGFLGDLGEFATEIFGAFGKGVEAGYDDVPHFATGGVVGSGQMFVARESGAELVGNIGNRTAVMNNDQIISAVSMGVYDAVVAAMSQSGGQSQSLQVFLNGKQIEASTRQTRQRRGAAIATGGVYNFA